MRVKHAYAQAKRAEFLRDNRFYNVLRNYLNGMTVLGFYRDTMFIRIPREIAADCPGGCICPYCVAHPETTPKWDTLAVDVSGRNDAYGHTWTVHMPDYNPLLTATNKPTKLKGKA